MNIRDPRVPASTRAIKGLLFINAVASTYDSAEEARRTTDYKKDTHAATQAKYHQFFPKLHGQKHKNKIIHQPAQRARCHKR